MNSKKQDKTMMNCTTRLATAITSVALAASSASAVAASASAPQLRDGGGDLSLTVFQRLLHTSLDEELDLIAGIDRNTSCRHCQGAAAEPSQHDTQEVYTRRVRRRDAKLSTSPFSPEFVWARLLQHAWRCAESLTREEGNDALLELISYPKEISKKHIDYPFLFCSNSGEDATKFFEEADQDLMWTPPASDGKCVVLMTTASWASKAMFAEEDIVAQPLVDIMKIHPGTIERVTSPEWKIPELDVSTAAAVHIMTHNATKALSNLHWERKLMIDLVPGLNIKKEAKLLDLVNTIIQDIQHLSTVGWAKRQTNSNLDINKENTKEWENEWLAAQSLTNVPPLFDMFSLISTTKDTREGREQDRSKKNERLEFWDASLANGLESSHACASLFSTLIVDTQHFMNEEGEYYTSFDLVLNPQDAQSPTDYDSSASNVDCITSLIAGLSVHPSVMGVQSNHLPEYHGWSHMGNGTMNNDGLNLNNKDSMM